MRSADEISRAIRSQLKIIDPDLSADPLTPERKIIDTVADAISEAEADKYVLQFQYDIDSKIGTDLDKFVAMFGFARQGSTKATGAVTFYLNTPATEDIFIPVNTRVQTQANSLIGTVVFSTTTSTVIFKNTYYADASIECLTAGEVGNVTVGAINSIGSASITQVSYVSNSAATSGGSQPETDAELRIRFKNTIFRNIAGTKHQFLALAIASQFANKARIIGPIERFVEYIQVPPSLTATSVIDYSKYTYNFDYYLTDPSTGTETFFTPGNDYTFNSSAPPSITVLATGTGQLYANQVLLLEHSYCSENSRNIPASGITNYVDVFVSGNDPQTVQEATAFPPSGTNRIVSSPTSSFYSGNFRRMESRVAPRVGNMVQRLLWQPITLLPSSITINGTAFYANSDYFLLEDTTLTKGSKRAVNGIEWGQRAMWTLTSGTSYSIEYTYNKLIPTLNELMDEHKTVGTDVLVHAAINRYFNVNLIVALGPGSTKSNIEIALAVGISDLFSKLSFGDIVQIGDIIEVAHHIPGVDNVRLARSGDSVAYGVQELAPDGTLIGLPITSDFFLGDSDLPVLSSVVVTIKSQNTWST